MGWHKRTLILGAFLSWLERFFQHTETAIHKHFLRKNLLILKSSKWSNYISREGKGKRQAFTGTPKTFSFLPCNSDFWISRVTLPLRPSAVFRLDQLGRGSWEIFCSWRQHASNVKLKKGISNKDGYIRYTLSSIYFLPSTTQVLHPGQAFVAIVAMLHQKDHTEHLNKVSASIPSGDVSGSVHTVGLQTTQKGRTELHSVNDSSDFQPRNPHHRLWHPCLTQSFHSWWKSCHIAQLQAPASKPTSSVWNPRVQLFRSRSSNQSLRFFGPAFVSFISFVSLSLDSLFRGIFFGCGPAFGACLTIFFCCGPALGTVAFGVSFTHHTTQW